MSDLTLFLETATAEQLDSLLESIQSAQDSMDYDSFVQSVVTVKEIEAAKKALVTAASSSEWDAMLSDLRN